MYFDRSQGNEKLGKQVVVLNRVVGLTCDPKCPLLNNGCYAEKTEKRFPNSRQVGLDNLEAGASDIAEAIEFAVQKNKDVRIHERGDFLLEGKLDKKYLNAWKKAINTVKKIPHIWTYTHSYLKSLANLNHVNVYASVHNENDVKKAKANGFKLFAYALTDRKRKGGSPDYPKFVDLPVIGKTLVCPEQRLGRKRVTCDKCRWCVEGKGNVAFLKT